HVFEFGERKRRVIIGIPILEIDLSLFACRRAALERDVDELGNGAAGRIIAKATLTQNRGFKGQLRRNADAHLLLGRHLPGLVVEDRMAPVCKPLDAIGTRAQREYALADRNLDAAGNFRSELGNLRAALYLPARKPMGNAL